MDFETNQWDMLGLGLIISPWHCISLTFNSDGETERMRRYLFSLHNSISAILILKPAKQVIILINCTCTRKNICSTNARRLTFCSASVAVAGQVVIISNSKYASRRTGLMVSHWSSITVTENEKCTARKLLSRGK